MDYSLKGLLRDLVDGLETQSAVDTQSLSRNHNKQLEVNKEH